MAEDEVGVLFASAVFALIYWGRWCIQAFTVGAGGPGAQLFVFDCREPVAGSLGPNHIT